MHRPTGAGKVILAAIMLAGCLAEPPPAYPVHVPQRAQPAVTRPAPIKEQAREIKTTIGKLKRKLEKREKLLPLNPPT